MEKHKIGTGSLSYLSTNSVGPRTLSCTHVYVGMRVGVSECRGVCVGVWVKGPRRNSGKKLIHDQKRIINYRTPYVLHEDLHDLPYRGFPNYILCISVYNS